MANRRPSAIMEAWAVFERPRDKDEFRGVFMRDTTRILHGDAFRRLGGKTQVFATGSHDLLRTRLTHRLEVASIARIVALKLRLRSSLAEAIALGHDLGHTPFGHVGENVLKLVSSGCDALGGKLPPDCFPEEDRGFKHNFQGLRVVMDLEERYVDDQGRPAPGLNLSSFVLWGILQHSRTRWVSACPHRPACVYGSFEPCPVGAANRRFRLSFYDNLVARIPTPRASLEAFVVAQADEIAQRHHDLEDGLASGVLDAKEAKDILKRLGLPQPHAQQVRDVRPEHLRQRSPAVRGIVTKALVGGLVEELVRGARKGVERFQEAEGIADSAAMLEWLRQPDDQLVDPLRKAVSYAEQFASREATLQQTLKTRVLHSGVVERMDGKARFILRQLFKAYVANPQQLPDSAVLRLVAQVPATAYQDVASITLQRKTLSEKVGRARALLAREVPRGHQGAFRRTLARCICDHIAAMTDGEALQEHRRLYSAREEAALAP